MRNSRYREQANKISGAKGVVRDLYKEAQNAAEEIIEGDFTEDQLDHFCSSLKKILYKQSEDLIKSYYPKNDSNSVDQDEDSDDESPSINIIIPNFSPANQGMLQIGNPAMAQMGNPEMQQMGSPGMQQMMNPAMSQMMNPAMPQMMNPAMSQMMDPTMMQMSNPAMMMPNQFQPPNPFAMPQPDLMNFSPLHIRHKHKKPVKKQKNDKKSKKEKQIKMPKDKKDKKEKSKKPKEKKAQESKSKKTFKNDLIFEQQYRGSNFQGILSELTSQAGGNIVTSGIIDITGNMNTTYNIPLSSIVNFKTSDCYGSSNKPNSFICFDFKSYAISLSAYSIRSSSYPMPSFLKSWVIEGSNDKTEWTTLDSHTNDNSLCSRRAERKFNIPSPKNEEAFKYIQLRSTGQSSGGSNQFEIQNIEFFGKYYYRDES